MSGFGGLFRTEDVFRCDSASCQDWCLPPFKVVPVVMAATTFAVFVPFMDSVGLGLHSAFSQGFHISPATILIIFVWIVSCVFNVPRRFENVYVCFLDTFGIPAVLMILASLK
jgi:hypothetical protein